MSLSLAPALAASAVSFLKISSKQTGSPEVMHLIAISNQAMALIFHTRGVPGPCRAMLRLPSLSRGSSTPVPATGQSRRRRHRPSTAKLCTVFLLLARAHIKILTAYDEQGQTGLTFLAGGEVPVNSDRGLRLELERT
jgi:hypothetical protein